ncbi:amidohydrolase family protein [Pedobacter psychroterrae]|uniref:Amidohydrolase n=1 Tax=Pedobacter psychroterrae TaxID=2530453 RepID=A0A4R0NNZ7_9SPHI|nr:amidohydrolase family protein [Pedobacter psychroterrae]TCD02641.1 amidohydrolase [Pedobacter psychroterrae]
MLTYISADYVYPVVAAPIACGVLAMDEEGTIAAVLTPEEASAGGITDIVRYEGLLVPGFVNTHCHLELSNLKGEIPRYTGLPAFVQEVIKLRSSDEYAINLAMLKADVEMFDNGIVAVGDISNQAVSAGIKAGSPLYYHTFLELLGFNPDTAKLSMERALEFINKFLPLKASIVPHAPYSVSPELFAELKAYGDAVQGLSSMHNQETTDENSFFRDKTGAFLDLFKFLGLNIEFFKPSGKTSLQTVLPQLSARQKLLLVHNVFTSAEDIKFAEAVHPDLYWCLCPNANLYIENRLPDVGLLRDAGLKITLGTDSLASNDVLSIFAEMQTLQLHFDVSVDDLLKWATYNGAEFLEITDRYGSLEAGKKPGINLLEYKDVEGELVLGDRMRRLF